MSKTAYKVVVSVVGENCDSHGWHTNSILFETEEDAKTYGRDLVSRWLAAKDWAIVPEDFPQNGVPTQEQREMG